MRKLLKTIIALGLVSSFKSTSTHKVRLILPKFRTIFLKSRAFALQLDLSVTFTFSTRY